MLPLRSTVLYCLCGIYCWSRPLFSKFASSLTIYIYRTALHYLRRCPVSVSEIVLGGMSWTGHLIPLLQLILPLPLPLLLPLPTVRQVVLLIGREKISLKRFAKIATPCCSNPHTNTTPSKSCRWRDMIWCYVMLLNAKLCNFTLVIKTFSSQTGRRAFMHTDS